MLNMKGTSHRLEQGATEIHDRQSHELFCLMPSLQLRLGDGFRSTSPGAFSSHLILTFPSAVRRPFRTDVKMPFSDFIDVSLHVDGAPLTEYPIPLPDRRREENHRRMRYVEVKAGQKFAVVIQLQPGFQFHSASHLRAVLHIDQEPRSMTAAIKGFPGCASGQDVLQAPRETRIESRLMRDETTGKWFTYALEFKDLHVGE